MNTDILRTKLRNLTFKNADALAKALKGGPVGFNPYTTFTAQNGSPMVHQYAEWMLTNFAHADIAAKVDGYVERSRAARSYIKARKGIPMPTTEAAKVDGTEADETEAAPDHPMMETPTPAPQYAEGSIEAMIQAICRATLAHEGAGVNPAQVIDIVKPVIDAAIDRAKLPRVTHIHVTRTAADGTTTTTDQGRQHKLYPDLLKLIEAGFPVWIPGPAGSGKTTAVNNAAKALGASLYMPPEGPVENKYGFIGYNDATGRFVETSLYWACKEAAENTDKLVIYFIDECDSGYANALMVLNAVMENGYCTFANGERVHFGRNLQFIAGANTFGNGATSQYVGRNKLDDATLDRFIMMAWDYDVEFEAHICGDAEWAAVVNRIRMACDTHTIKHVVSPRASIRGAELLRRGWDKSRVMDMTIFKGMKPDHVRQVKTTAGIR
jgi:cobaltochelatase CobS